jgi:hypothetical protein
VRSPRHRPVVNPPLQIAACGQDQPGQYHGDERQAMTSEARGHADGGRHPDPGGGRQALRLPLVSRLENRPRPEKADAGRQALNDPRYLRGCHADVQARHDEERGAHGHQHVRAEPRVLPGALALRAHDGAQERRDDDSRGKSDELRRIGQAARELGEKRVHHLSAASFTA